MAYLREDVLIKLFVSNNRGRKGQKPSAFQNSAVEMIWGFVFKFVGCIVTSAILAIKITVTLVDGCKIHFKLNFYVYFTLYFWLYCSLNL